MFGITLLAGVYGAVLEMCQACLAQVSHPDPWDALANVTGALVASWISFAWYRRKQQRRYTTQKPVLE